MKKVPVKVSENATVYIEMEENELEYVNEEKKVARGSRLNLDTALDCIKEVSDKFCNVLEKISPKKATVELGFEISASEGILISTLVSGKSKAGIKVTLEWEKNKTND